MGVCLCGRRYVAQVIAESTATGSGQRPFYDFLESCLRHKAELVIFEAARAIVAMPEVTARELAPAITVLQLFLTSSKPVLRFASVRTLNKARFQFLKATQPFAEEYEASLLSAQHLETNHRSCAAVLQQCSAGAEGGHSFTISSNGQARTEVSAVQSLLVCGGLFVCGGGAAD